MAIMLLEMQNGRSAAMFSCLWQSLCMNMKVGPINNKSSLLPFWTSTSETVLCVQTLFAAMHHNITTTSSCMLKSFATSIQNNYDGFVFYPFSDYKALLNRPLSLVLLWTQKRFIFSSSIPISIETTLKATSIWILYFNRDYS